MAKDNTKNGKLRKLNFTSIREAVEILDKGGLVVLPTDTNYCVFCDYKNPNAIDRLYKAKRRSGKSPLLITVPNHSYISKLANPNDLAQDLIDYFWPAQFSVILEKTDEIADFVVRGLDTVGLGCHKHEALKMLFKLRPIPLASSSANMSKEADPKTAQDVLSQIGDSIDLIIDDGRLQTSHANTIIDFSFDPPVVARLGEFPLHLIRQIIPNIDNGMTKEEYKTLTSKKVSDNWISV